MSRTKVFTAIKLAQSTDSSILCRCKVPAKLLQVKKEGPNHGKYFYTCGNQKTPCKFFLWKEAEPEKQGIKRKAEADSSAATSATGVSINDLRKTLFVFTDGSCIGNHAVATTQNPAGWGFVVVQLKEETLQQMEEELIANGRPLLVGISTTDFFSRYFTATHCTKVSELHGPVIIENNEHYSLETVVTYPRLENPNVLKSFSFGANVASNNTGELCAIGEAILWLKEYFADKIYPKYFFILYDSEYAAKSVMRVFNGKKNMELIQNIRSVYDDVNILMKRHQRTYPSSQPPQLSPPFSSYPPGISFLHIKAHADHYWNDFADRLAKKGSRGMICNEGRYAKLFNAEGSIITTEKELEESHKKDEVKERRKFIPKIPEIITIQDDRGEVICL
jgi:ribonuclease HI